MSLYSYWMLFKLKITALLFCKGTLLSGSYQKMPTKMKLLTIYKQFFKSHKFTKGCLKQVMQDPCNHEI